MHIYDRIVARNQPDPSWPDHQDNWCVTERIRQSVRARVRGLDICGPQLLSATEPKVLVFITHAQCECKRIISLARTGLFYSPRIFLAETHLEPSWMRTGFALRIRNGTQSSQRLQP